jgi:two-component system, OmpR family, sensor histidine kinase CpxA
MKIRFPLYAKILAWSLANLLILVVIFFWLFQLHLPPGLKSALTAWVGERLQAVSELISADLRATTKGQGNSVLQRYSQAYNIQFYLFTPAGKQVAGESVELPVVVVRELETVARPTLGPGQGLGLGRGRGAGGGGPWWQHTSDLVRSHGPLHLRMQQHFFVRSLQPKRYWAGVFLPPAGPEHMTEGPIILVAMSDSLAGGGLFVDYTPWLTVAAGVFCLSAVIWFFPVRGITRSVHRMTQATARIADGHFESRVSLPRRDELGQLGESIDQMAVRLSTLVNGQKRFLGDVAHELCSPLARMQMSLGVLEQRIDPDQRARLEDLREELELMSSLVNELLSFSRASFRAQGGELQPVLVQTAIEKAVQREASENQEINISVPDGLTVEAEPELLTRALANLLRNSIRYAGDAGPITVLAEVRNSRVHIILRDQGPGIPETDLHRLFEPFYRPDVSRQRETGGFGLGLAIVKTCIEKCQGSVKCRNLQPRGFEVELELAASADKDAKN